MTTDLIPNDQLLEGSVAFPSDPKHSDGIVPKKFWVSPNGANGDANGTKSNPFLTITFALTKCGDGRGDTIYIGPGEYAERVTVDKKNVALIGTGGRHTGLTQIIGPSTGATATVYVASAYLRGFKLANVELDTNGVSRPAIHLQTNSTEAGSQAAVSMRASIANVAVRSDDPSVGLMLEGATLCDFSDLQIDGPGLGIAFTGSANNTCSNLRFKRVSFNHGGFSGTPTANIACVSSAASTTITAQALTNVVFDGVEFGDSVVTNFINLPAGQTSVGVKFANCTFPKAPTNGTNGVATLPTNVVVLGHGTSGLVSLKG